MSKKKQKFKSSLLILPFVKLWQIIRPIRKALNLGDCRFYPSCSNYYIEAIEKHGLLNGNILGIKRILKCNPLFIGGVDKVPEHLHCNQIINKEVIA